ncbi:MAG: hypothetical protein RIS26_972 [Actinomycetota bacterium]
MSKFVRGAVVAGIVVSLVAVGSIQAQAADATCTPISKELSARRLGKLYAYAEDVTAGKVLVNVRSKQQTPSASVMKTVTAAAAIKYLVHPREVAQLTPYVASTKVYTIPTEPGTLIIKGGGDHSLTRVGSTSYTTYYLPGQHPAKLRIIARNVLAALPAETLITKIVLDDTIFQGPTWNPNWYAYSRTSGDAAPITGLMVDAGRVNPDLTDKQYSGVRVTDPTMQAGKFFQKWLGAQASGAKLVKGVTPATAVEVFSADSQPITNWIRHALKISDNTETEVIARHTELALRLPNHYSSVQRMGRRLFSSLGADYKKLIMKDASGLAQENRVTPLLLAQLMKAAADPTSDIGSLPSFMATSGDGGTLGGRFVAYNKTTKRYELVIPNGSIRAKTGYIGGLYSLAGIITTPENHTIVFAIFARQDAARKLYVGAGTKEAIDGIVEKLYLCGSKP